MGLCLKKNLFMGWVILLGIIWCVRESKKSHDCGCKWSGGAYMILHST